MGGKERAGDNTTPWERLGIFSSCRHWTSWLSGTFGMSEDIWWDVCTMYYSIHKWMAALRSTQFRGQPEPEVSGVANEYKGPPQPPPHKFWLWKKSTHISRGLPVTWKAWRCTEKCPKPLEKGDIQILRAYRRCVSRQCAAVLLRKRHTSSPKHWKQQSLSN